MQSQENNYQASIQTLTVVDFIAAPSATTGIASVVDNAAPVKLHRRHIGSHGLRPGDHSPSQLSLLRDIQRVVLHARQA